MGETVEFSSKGRPTTAYLAVPESGSGPGIVVIQEWWGLVPHIEDVCDRLAREGFVALAPDLYHGKSTTEPDEAGKLMMTLNILGAIRDMGGAVEFLLGHDAVTSETLGTIGFCMGGGLAMILAASQGTKISACAPFYGIIPWEMIKPDWSKLQSSIRGHFAEDDGFFTPEQVAALEQHLQGLGKDAVLEIHPGVDHAFFNDTRPEVYDATESAKAWASTLAYFRETVT